MRCPYCSARMTDEQTERYAQVRMSKRQQEIYNLILASGTDGVPASLLRERYGLNGAKVTLRTAIHGINKVIRPLMIRSRHGNYRVERRLWSS